jgi:serine/threonine protein kinase
VGDSLSKILSSSPEWWNPTAKAKAVLGLVLGLRFCHSLGLLHGHLTSNNVLFDEEGTIQITDFGMKSLGDLKGNESAKIDVGGFSGESWTPKEDIRAFAGILSEIVVGASAEQSVRNPSVPSFIFEMIKRGQSADSKTSESFADILKTLKSHSFEIIEGCNIQEVSNFVSWIEGSERLTE